MNTLKKCEACGSDTEFRIEGSTEGFFCTKCDWALVTSHIPEIAQDITKYRVYLLHADPHNLKQIKALSSLANVNFIKAREMTNMQRPLIIEDEAIEIDNARKALDKAAIKYQIEPKFPYS